MLLPGLGSGVNRGIVRVLEATEPADAVKDVGVGAKLRLTVEVPAGGEFCGTFAVNVVYTPKAKVSFAFGFVFLGQVH